MPSAPDFDRRDFLKIAGLGLTSVLAACTPPGDAFTSTPQNQPSSDIPTPFPTATPKPTEAPTATVEPPQFIKDFESGKGLEVNWTTENTGEFTIDGEIYNIYTELSEASQTDYFVNISLQGETYKINIENIYVDNQNVSFVGKSNGNPAIIELHDGVLDKVNNLEFGNYKNFSSAEQIPLVQSKEALRQYLKMLDIQFAPNSNIGFIDFNSTKLDAGKQWRQATFAVTEQKGFILPLIARTVVDEEINGWHIEGDEFILPFAVNTKSGTGIFVTKTYGKEMTIDGQNLSGPISRRNIEGILRFLNSELKPNETKIFRFAIAWSDVFDPNVISQVPNAAPEYQALLLYSEIIHDLIDQLNESGEMPKEFKVIELIIGSPATTK
jgi:hypothetical protein